MISSIIGMLFLLSWVLSQQVIQPIRELTTQIIRFADKIDNSRSDELGEVATALNTASRFLKGLFDDVKNTANLLGESANTINAASNKITSNTESTHSHIEQTATAITEMSSTAQEVAQNASGVANSAGEADQASKSGLSVMHDTIKTIDTLAQEVQSASNVIRKLEEDTNSVGTVLEVIRGRTSGRAGPWFCGCCR